MANSIRKEYSTGSGLPASVSSIDQARRARGRGPIDPGGGDGNNGDMEQRVKDLENTMVEVRERLARMETRLGQTATGEDVARVEASLLKWFIGTAVALTALAFSAAKLIN